MPSRYEPLTGIDMSDKKFIVKEEPVKTSLPQNRKISQYKKFSEKPVTVTPAAVKPEPPKDITPADETPLRARSNFKIYLWVLCGALLMTAWVWEIAYVRKELTQIEIMKDKKLELEKQNEGIRVEIAKYAGYDRIERASTEHLNLAPAKDKPGVIFIDADKINDAARNDSLARMQGQSDESKPAR